MRCSYVDGHRRRPRIAFAVRCSCFRCAAALSACTLPAYPRLENHPFDVDAALPCLRPGFPILASRQSRRQIEASIDRGQSSRTHATGHAVESPSRLRWQPRIIVRYSRGPQPRRNTKWRRPRYTLKCSSSWDCVPLLWLIALFALACDWSQASHHLCILQVCFVFNFLNSLFYYFLNFKFSNFVCPSELHPFIWFFFKNSFRKKKNIRKTTQNALAPSIFVWGSRGAVVSAALSERKVAGSIPTIGDFHTVGPCKKAVFACLATDVK